MHNTGSYSSFVDEDVSPKSPYIELGVVCAVNLDLHSEGSEDLSPYVTIRQDEKEWQTSVADTTAHAYVWNEVFYLYIDFDKPFVLTVSDRDDYGGDILLAGFVIPPRFLNSSELRELWLRIPPAAELNVSVTAADLPTLCPALLGNKYDQVPMLLIQVQYIVPESLSKYSVSFERHRNVADSGNNYTLYEVKVHRVDRVNWTVELRYSQVYQLRQELLQVLPTLATLPFAGKTYFEFLKGVCTSASRFYLPRIERRKADMSCFLNRVLEEYQHVQSNTLNSLLDLDNT